MKRQKQKLTDAEKAEMKKARIEKRRALLAAEKSLDAVKRAEMLAAAGALRSVDGVALSPKNTLLVLMQAGAAGFAPSMVGGFKQWRNAGRCVKKGAKGLLICFPKFGAKDSDGSEDGADGENGGGVQGFGWGYVFDISQTVERGAEDGAENEKEYQDTEMENENEKTEGDEMRKKKTETGPDLFEVQAVEVQAETKTDAAANVPDAPKMDAAADDPAAALLAAFAAA